MKVLLFSQITFKQAWEEVYPVILEKGNQNVIVISPAVMVMWPNLFVFFKVITCKTFTRVIWSFFGIKTDRLLELGLQKSCTALLQLKKIKNG